MYDAILFDLDGTLLGLDNDHFVNIYFKALGQKLSPWYPDGEIIPLIVQATEAMIKAKGDRGLLCDVFRDASGRRRT